MQVLDRIDGFRKELDAARMAGRTVGLVPTMGSLHDGHASLMRAAARENAVVAATIFVNPLQFGANEDLSAYPRDLDRDKGVAIDNGVGHLFTPSVDEMYPFGVPTLTSVHVAEVSALTFACCAFRSCSFSMRSWIFSLAPSSETKPSFTSDSYDCALCRYSGSVACIFCSVCRAEARSYLAFSSAARSWLNASR